MTRDVHSALATHFDQYAVAQELHHELPHTTYEVTIDGQRAVCKVASGDEVDVGAEAAVCDHLDRTTEVPVPSILAAEKDAFVATWADSIPGEDGVPDAENLPTAEARALGATMAHIHEETADQFDRHGFPRFSPVNQSASDGEGPATTDQDARGRFLTVDAREDWLTVVGEFLESHRSSLAQFGWADPADQVLALLDDRPTLFDGAGTPVLCHGNIYPEHAGFEAANGDAGSDETGRRTDPDAVTAVIDFEHALVAPAEYDFWRTGLPVFHTGELEPRPHFSAFREGYESVRSLPDGVQGRRDAFWLVNTVTYFTSLALENDGIGPDERAKATTMAEWVDDTVASPREPGPSRRDEK